MTPFLFTAFFLTVALTTTPAISYAEDTSTQRACAPTLATPPALAGASLVIFGELHGTNETPALVFQFVCQTVTSGKSVGVAFEIPSSEQPLIDTYLASGGTHADRLALLRGPFWQRDFQDGRSSTAMANLVESLRRLKADTHLVHVVAIDSVLPGMKRDASMAQTLKATMESSASDRWVVLVGNVHAAKVNLIANIPDYKSFAYHLAAEQPFTVNIEFSSGSAWNCKAVCGISTWHEQGSVSPTGFQLGTARLPGFDAAFRIGTATASEPAVSQVTVN